jgi:hypothetical protein
LFPCRGGHSLNWMIPVHARFGSFLGGPEARRRQRVTLPHKNWTIVPISKYTI